MNSFALDKPKRYAFCYSLLLLLGIFVLQPSLGQAQTVSSLSITPSAPAVNIGGTTQLTVTATYSNGSSSNISSGVSWSTADTRLVNVSGSGLVSGIASGNVGITASYQGHTASTSVN